MTVISNTSPLRYLILIDQFELNPKLFDRVFVPQAVCDELGASVAPTIVRNWISSPPDWLEIQSVSTLPDVPLQRLGAGEREAILLAEELEADLILLDDMQARRLAVERGLIVTGLLGLLQQSATLGLIDLTVAIERLRETNFWISSSLLQSLLEQDLSNPSAKSFTS